MSSLILPNTRIVQHPFIEGIEKLLRCHFADNIVTKFRFDFEKDIYRKDVEAIWLQNKEEKYVVEVRYPSGDGYEYICDVRSWESRGTTEARLLRYITDKYKEGKIGKEWNMGEDSSIIFEKGTHETHDSPTNV